MKRLTLFLGHYGSGKTNLAVNWAMKAAEEGKKVEIIDPGLHNENAGSRFHIGR